MKKIITILFMIMLLLTIFQIRDTYALYKAEITGELQTLLGVWSVRVNETDISSGNADMTFEITDAYLHFEENEFVDGNVIAPGSEAYFDIFIDATNTDVSVRYNLQIADKASIKIGEEIEELENGFKIELVGIEETFENGEDIDTTTEHINFVDIENGKVSGVLPLSVIENGYKSRVRVRLKWVNDDTESQNKIDTLFANAELGNKLGYTTGNNDIDTMLLNNETQPSIVIPVQLELIQYMGEEITSITTP